MVTSSASLPHYDHGKWLPGSLALTQSGLKHACQAPCPVNAASLTSMARNKRLHRQSSGLLAVPNLDWNLSIFSTVKLSIMSCWNFYYMCLSDWLLVRLVSDARAHWLHFLLLWVFLAVPFCKRSPNSAEVPWSVSGNAGWDVCLCIGGGGAIPSDVNCRQQLIKELKLVGRSRACLGPR